MERYDFSNNVEVAREVGAEIEYVAGVIQVAIRNGYGMDITESCHGLYMALITGAHIAINNEDGDAVLGLVYDPKKFV